MMISCFQFVVRSRTEKDHGSILVYFCDLAGRSLSADGAASRKAVKKL